MLFLHLCDKEHMKPLMTFRKSLWKFPARYSALTTLSECLQSTLKSLKTPWYSRTSRISRRLRDIRFYQQLSAL